MNIFITATDTDVGKTVITGALAGALVKLGYSVGVYKPVQTGCIVKNGIKTSPDLDFINKISPEIKTKASYLLAEPVAPYTAAVLENIEITREKILEDYNQLKNKCDFVIVEGAGGLLTPIYKKFLIRDMIELLDLPVIIVARPNLGTINHTLLTIESAKNANIEVLGVIISNYPQNVDNTAIKTAPKLIEEFSGVKVLGVLPHFKEINTPPPKNFDLLINSVLNNINIEELFRIKNTTGLVK
jgi:dethiobiotin synthetase